MKNRQQLEHPQELLERHLAFWQRQIVEKPLIRVDAIPVRIDFPAVEAIYGSEAGRAISPEEADVDRYLAAVDWEFLVEPGNAELFDVLPPYVRIPWLEAIGSCRVIPQPSSDSIWSEAPQPQPIEPRSIHLDTDWFEALRSQTERLSKDDAISCPTGQTVLRGPGDLAEAVIGAEALCLAMMDQAGWLQSFLQSCTDLFVKAAHCQLDIIGPLWNGYFNYFGFWSPEPCVRLQEDVQRILTPDLYHRWLRPGLQRCVQEFPFSMFHIHSGSLNMAGEVISVVGLDALEIAVDEPPYAPPITEQIDQLRKIQQKIPIFIEGRLSSQEVDKLVEELSPQGLAIRAASWVRDERKGKR